MPALTDALADLSRALPAVEGPVTLGRLQGLFAQVRTDHLPIRMAIEAADQAVLGALAQAGHVPAMALVVQPAWELVHEATIEPVRQLAPRVVLGVDGAGHLAPLVPTVGPTAWQDRPASVLGMHAFALCHEAAHVAHAALAHPFASSQVAPAVAHDLNAFLLGPLAAVNGFFRKVYSELFADVYGTLLLATVGGDAPWVAEQVGNVIQARAQNRDADADPSLLKREIVVSLPHLTDRAVAHTWAHRAQWQGLAPTDRLAWAQQCASDAWLALVRPGRLLGPDQVPLDDRLVRVLGRDLLESFDHGTAAPLVGHHAIDPASSRLTQWQAAYPDHPVLALAVSELAKLQAGQAAGQVPFASFPAAQRAGLATDFIYTGMDRRGGAVRAELAQRAQALTEQLQASAAPRTPAPRSRGLRR